MKHIRSDNGVYLITIFAALLASHPMWNRNHGPIRSGQSLPGMSYKRFSSVLQVRMDLTNNLHDASENLGHRPQFHRRRCQHIGQLCLIVSEKTLAAALCVTINDLVSSVPTVHSYSGLNKTKRKYDATAWVHCYLL